MRAFGVRVHRILGWLCPCSQTFPPSLDSCPTRLFFHCNLSLTEITLLTRCFIRQTTTGCRRLSPRARHSHLSAAEIDCGTRCILPYQRECTSSTRTRRRPRGPPVHTTSMIHPLRLFTGPAACSRLAIHAELALNACQP